MNQNDKSNNKKKKSIELCESFYWDRNLLENCQSKIVSLRRQKKKIKYLFRLKMEKLRNLSW